MPKGVLERALLVCGGIALALIATEVLVYLGYWAVRGQRFPREHYRSAMVEQRNGSGTRPAAAGAGEWGHLAVHPYLGFVPDPAEMQGHTTIGDPSQILPRSDTGLVVGVFGGSFAAGLCAFARAELTRVLARPGKGVRLICMGAGGYKQPQQFMALAYMLAQGAHFDLVINVDGFNEVVLPPLDNLTQGVAPIYPRAWFWLVGNVLDPDALKLLGAISVVDRERRDWADAFLSWRLHHSALLALVWERRDRRFGSERDGLVAELLERKIEQRKSYATTGPAMAFPDDRSLDDYDVRIWRDASRQMKLLCDANGIAYHHFLQPNQHVPGSKPMGPEELRLAGPGPYRDAVVRGYPLLRQQGEGLRRSGVRFHDLTMLFKDVQDTLYSDGCCHLNPAGYARIARAIGDSIQSDAEIPP